jgi:pilus assembly protein CpaE
VTLVYERRGSAAQQLADILGPATRVVGSLDELSALLAGNPEELLVVLGAGTDLADAVRFAVAHRITHPALGVVLLREEVDATVLAEALRAGIREVVASAEMLTVRAACERSLALSRLLAKPTWASVPEPEATAPEGGEAKIVTVFAPKGGCGKTTLATNLAVALSAGGAHRVCLVDLDLAFGDVAIMLQLPPDRNIGEAVSIVDRLDETAVRSMLTRYRPGVDTLLAPPTPADGEKVTRGVVTEVLRIARSMFDYIVIDTAPAFNEQVLAALDASHKYVLLAAPDIPTLKNLRVALDTFDLLGFPADRRLVVLNRADAKVGLTAADIARILRTPIAANIPSSRDVPVSINRGVPIVADQPNHPVAKAVRDFAQVSLLREPATAARTPGRRLFGPRKQK